MKPNTHKIKVRVFHQGNGVYLYADCSDLCTTATYGRCTEPYRILAIKQS